MSTVLALAYNAKVTIGLAAAFFVILPVLAHGLLAVTFGTMAREHNENVDLRDGSTGEQ